MESCLLKLKKDYEKLRQKYKLPSFNELNEEFEIEKLQERETDFLLRHIRRAMIEKIAIILRFLEVLVNPAEAQTQLYIFSVMKSISAEMKKDIEKIYKEMTMIELSSLSLDIDYNEKNEVRFIKEIMEKWPKIKKELKEVTNKLGVVWTHEKMHTGYFG
ncbi:MAG: hypothetical protein QW041_00155 [Candidatus Pacearchaeota archaeon]